MTIAEKYRDQLRLSGHEMPRTTDRVANDEVFAAMESEAAVHRSGEHVSYEFSDESTLEMDLTSGRPVTILVFDSRAERDAHRLAALAERMATFNVPIDINMEQPPVGPLPSLVIFNDGEVACLLETEVIDQGQGKFERYTVTSITRIVGNVVRNLDPEGFKRDFPVHEKTLRFLKECLVDHFPWIEERIAAEVKTRTDEAKRAGRGQSGSFLSVASADYRVLFNNGETAVLMIKGQPAIFIRRRWHLEQSPDPETFLRQFPVDITMEERAALPQSTQDYLNKTIQNAVADRRDDEVDGVLHTKEEE